MLEAGRYRHGMKPVLAPTLLFLVLLPACSEPPPRKMAEPSTSESILGTDVTMMGAKCIAITSLPEYSSPKNTELRRRWQRWLDPQMSPMAIANLVQTNMSALSAEPSGSLAVALPECLKQIDSMCPKADAAAGVTPTSCSI
jgi:hypothetical protein